MEKIKDTLFIIALIVIIGLLVFMRISPPENNGAIPPEVQKKLDSLAGKNIQLSIDKARLQEQNNNLAKKIWELNNQLANIKPKYIPVYKEYNEGTREKKSEMVNREYEKRLKERDNDK